MAGRGRARVRTEWRLSSEIGGALLEELRAFRLTMVRLKPEVTPEKDRQKLASYFAHPGARVAVFRGPEGGIRGFAGFCDERAEIEGRELCVMTPEYLFLGPGLRGTGVMARTALTWIAGVLARYPLIPKYSIALSYPASFIAGSRAMGRVLLATDPDLSSTERALFRWFRRTRLGGGPDGATWLGTLPPPADPRSAAGRRALARYEEANPRWREGYAISALVSFGRVGGPALRTMLGDAVRRTLRRGAQ